MKILTKQPRAKILRLSCRLRPLAMTIKPAQATMPARNDDSLPFYYFFIKLPINKHCKYRSRDKN
ncbi:hypothetical protein FEC77_00930 [Rickettsia parkeri]|nr:hypothetical protein FEC77_00930 [Rickettsia parkeri]